MKLFKKLFTITVFALVAVALVGCKKDSGANKTLVVGTPGLSGDFVAGFGSSSYDVSIRDLVHGYGTLVETELGEFVWDTEAVLKAAPTTSVDANGNKTYKFEIQEDLKWNTGEAIKAVDFVLPVLLRSSKDWTSIATSANAGYYLVGFEDYRYGPFTMVEKEVEGELKEVKEYEADYTVLDVKFPGVRLTGEFKFEFTIAAENLPYFYETTMVSTAPMDLETYLPGFEVKDSADGAYITKATGTAEDATIASTIALSVNNPAVGQRYKPTVTSGPYQFVNFIRDIATVELNPHFKTNYEGKKPSIGQIQVKKINQTTDVDQVIAGTVDIVAGVVEGAKIEAAKDAKSADVVSYARNGYGMIAFATDFGPIAEPKVRQAIGYLFDRNEFLTQILGGYGTLVNGPFGEAMWFYAESKAELEGVLENFVLNPTRANELLDESSYKFEADGTTPFDPSKVSSGGTYFRHNAAGEVLEYNHLGTTENEITVLIDTQLTANAWRAGVKASVTQSDFDTLLNNYYYGPTLADRKYHSFNLATGFYSDYDPFWSWHSSLVGTTNNPTQLADDELDGIMEAMQKLDPTQKEEFRELFVDFAIRWNQLLPTLPIYSNEYFDVFNVRVQGLKTTPVWGWAKDICDLTIK